MHTGRPSVPAGLHSELSASQRGPRLGSQLLVYPQAGYLYGLWHLYGVYLDWPLSRSRPNQNQMVLRRLGVVMLFNLYFVYMPLFIYGQENSTQLPFPVIVSMDTVEIPWLAFDRLTVFYVVASMMFAFLLFAINIHAIAKIGTRVLPG
ncbi:GerAB/ArcD/ProY family transporter [Paenibacillus sp. CC-CFT747]|nr:GerAB/ArcD/ProY family transporter [Paenibacillus sp. CC-CFT747]